MARMFGTDGVRGVANQDLTCELAFKLGQASAFVLASNVHRPTILVGRDTRISGEMLESALVAGICSVGARAVLVDVLPTPGIAYLTRYYQADAGVVISASHNTVEYNGIKFFDKNGCKLPDAVEDRIEEIILHGDPKMRFPVGAKVGRPVRQRNAQRRYIDYVKETIGVRLDGLHIVVDCAQGASSQVAPVVLGELGAVVSAYYHEPDGTNINENCGSTHPERLCELVRELGADVGLAFDGDADRLIAVDERGQIVNGDQVMCICAAHLKSQGRLRNNTLVTTIMSNMGLDLALKKLGIQQVKTRVGDRYVLENMLENNYNLGGEQSGHVIFRDYVTTGDGQLTALQLLCLLKRCGEPLSELAKVMTRLPQVMENVKVSAAGKLEFYNNDAIKNAIREKKELLGDTGRVLVRVSGTEPLIRVMVEGQDETLIQSIATELAELVRSELA